MKFANPFKRSRKSYEVSEENELRQFVYLDSLTLKSLIASYSAIPESSKRINEDYKEAAGKAELSFKPVPILDTGGKTEISGKAQTAKKIEIGERINDQHLFTILHDLLAENNQIIDFDYVSREVADLETPSNSKEEDRKDEFLNQVSEIDRGDVVKFTGWCYLQKDTDTLLAKAHNPTSEVITRLHEMLHDNQRQPEERAYILETILGTFGVQIEEDTNNRIDVENLTKILNEIKDFGEVVNELSMVDITFLRTLVWPDSPFHYPYFMTLKGDSVWISPERMMGMRHTIVGRVIASLPREPEERNEDPYWEMTKNYDVSEIDEKGEDAVKNHVTSMEREYPYNMVDPKIILIEPIAIYW